MDILDLLNSSFIEQQMNKDFSKYLKYNKENEKITVGVAMSGGVDSSTVAYILKKQGYNIFGVTMKTFNDEDSDAKKSVMT